MTDTIRGLIKVILTWLKLMPAHREDEVTFTWGPLQVHFSDTVQHFMAVGAPGSGKTIIVRLLMQDVLPMIRPGSDCRAMIYDAKEDTMSVLKALGLQVEIWNFSPFDERGVSWAIYRDVTEPRVAAEIATIVMPAAAESQPYFTRAGRHLLYAVMLSFIVRKLKWRLSDLIRCFFSAQILRRVLNASPESRPYIGKYFADRRVLENVLSTVHTHLMLLETAAASWDSASRSVALCDWADGEGIAVLGNSELSRAAIDCINAALFRVAKNYTLKRAESQTSRTWFIFDEASEAGKLEGLVSLCKKGRSKGACVVLVMQTAGAFRDPKLYGPDQAAEILGQIGHRFFGRIECSETAEWASRLFGDQEVMRMMRGTSTSADGKQSVSFSQQIATQRAVLPVEFMDVPPCNRENGLTGYYLSRTAGALKHTMDGGFLFDELLDPRSAADPDFVARDVAAQYLKPWTKEEEALFAPRRKKKRRTTSDSHVTDRNKPDKTVLESPSPASPSPAPPSDEATSSSTKPVNAHDPGIDELLNDLGEIGDAPQDNPLNNHRPRARRLRRDRDEPLRDRSIRKRRRRRRPPEESP